MDTWVYLLRRFHTPELIRLIMLVGNPAQARQKPVPYEFRRWKRDLDHCKLASTMQYYFFCIPHLLNWTVSPPSFQGKGYPDLCTRTFVHLLSETGHRRNSDRPSKFGVVTPPRFYALVDGDPDGMAIMSTYKYGSMAHAHESARLNAPGLQWLGVRISDAVAGADTQGDDALIPLSSRDWKRARAMLMNSPAFAEDGPELGWRAELQTMLMLNLKAETEILYEREGGLEGWIDRKMVVLDRLSTPAEEQVFNFPECEL
ncbi:hypothetical protein VTN77DRAFT_2735 [Rasamsonia byssochlamydoides]|uniref:uncharacterized protein n=1 Tax=Rasamsonia byssochlamydoides TaxID=89139 RepID=UPI003742578C